VAANLVHVQETSEDSDIVVSSRITCVSICTFVPVKQVAFVLVIIAFELVGAGISIMRRLIPRSR
jgi:hypothetical protein